MNMTLMRWTPRHRQLAAREPFRLLAHDMERLFDDFFRLVPADFRATGHQGEALRYSPNVNLRETDEAYVVDVEVPGFAKEELGLEVDGNRLTLTGERKAEEKDEDEGYLRREMCSANFRRELAFDAELEAQGHDAKLTDGVLTVTLKKRAAPEHKTVKVQIG